MPCGEIETSYVYFKAPSKKHIARVEKAECLCDTVEVPTRTDGRPDMSKCHELKQVPDDSFCVYCRASLWDEKFVSGENV